MMTAPPQSDFGELQQPPPQLDADEAEAIALHHFGVRGSASPLGSERDRNFLIAGDDARFVLKIVNAAENPAISAFQTALAEHVANHRPGLPVPGILRDREGRTAPVAHLRSGEDHVVRLVEFLPGIRAADQPLSDRERLSAAASLARLDLVLARFAAPVPTVEILWNIAEADRVLPLMPSIDDDGDRILVDRALAAWQSVAPRLGGLRRQVVHNDLNRHNLLIDEAGEVAGIIDFGDALEAPLICDLATAISYQLAGDAGDLDRIADMAAAYHAVLPLKPDEVALLADLIPARWAIAIAITHWRASLHPDNRSYIVRNVAAARAALRGIARWPRAAITEHLLARLEPKDR